MPFPGLPNYDPWPNPPMNPTPGQRAAMNAYPDMGYIPDLRYGKLRQKQFGTTQQAYVMGLTEPTMAPDISRQPVHGPAWMQHATPEMGDAAAGYVPGLQGGSGVRAGHYANRSASARVARASQLGSWGSRARSNAMLFGAAGGSLGMLAGPAGSAIGAAGGAAAGIALGTTGAEYAAAGSALWGAAKTGGRAFGNFAANQPFSGFTGLGFAGMGAAAAFYGGRPDIGLGIAAGGPLATRGLISGFGALGATGKLGVLGAGVGLGVAGMYGGGMLPDADSLWSIGGPAAVSSPGAALAGPVGGGLLGGLGGAVMGRRWGLFGAVAGGIGGAFAGGVAGLGAGAGLAGTVPAATGTTTTLAALGGVGAAALGKWGLVTAGGMATEYMGARRHAAKSRIGTKVEPRASRYFMNRAARAFGPRTLLRRSMRRLAKRPGAAAGLLGAALSLPTLFRGLSDAMAPLTQEYPKLGVGTSAGVYGMDANNLNTQGLVQALHYGRL